MIKHQHCSLDLTQLLQPLFYRIPELPLGELLLGIQTRMRQTVFPVGFFIRKREQRPIAPAALPFILGNIDDDAIEIGAEQRLAAKSAHGTVEAKKYFLRKVFYIACPGKARQRAKDHCLVFANNLLEAGIGGVQVESD